MAVALGNIHHLALTVSDTARSKAFYMNILGFKHLADIGPRILVISGSTIIALTPPSDPSQPVIPDDRFSENRIGLDHLSFTVGSKVDLDAAMKLFDEQGVPHGTINDLGEYGLPIYVLAFRDPDNIQLELTAPHA